MNSSRYAGRVAVVTGGSGGIGRAVCEALAAEGALVYGGFLTNESAMAELAGRMAAMPGQVLPFRIDVADPTSVEEAFGAIVRADGRLDIFVHAAGATTDGLLLRTSARRVEDALNLNLQSAICVTRAALGPMLRARYGRIVLVSSVVAHAGNAGQTLYGAAKAGQEGFARSLAREVGSRGITVNCVAPGLIDAGMTAAMDEVRRARALESAAVPRPGRPEEVAHAVCFLCDERAGYVTGAVLHVNGGMYM